MSFEYAQAYRLMYLIRKTEEEIVERYHRDKQMRCPTHLSIGQEGAAVGVAMAIGPQDQMYAYHRSHAHYLAKGGDLPAMIAELHGKATGCTRGWGGSMHLADAAVNFTESCTAVGNCVSMAVGAAMAFKLDGSKRVAVACSGDATAETGQFWESVNFAALHSLPIMFICENNLYSTATPISQRQPETQIYERVKSFMWSRRVEDDDVEAVWEAAKQCRAAQPAFLEIGTYRYLEHVGPNYDWDLGYRSEQEVLEHMARDPLPVVRKRLSEREAAQIESEVDGRVLDAFEEAMYAPWPKGF